MSQLSLVGLISILLGLLVYYQKTKSRGEMDTKMGRFKGPVWFLLIIFGLILMTLDSTLT